MNNTNNINTFLEQLQKGNGLVFSEGTLNVAELLCESYTFLKTFNMSKQLRNGISFMFNKEPTSGNYFFGKVTLKVDEYEASEYLNESVFDYFNEVAPKGFYFGTLEGDGSCFGWWKDFEAEEDIWDNGWQHDDKEEK